MMPWLHFGSQCNHNAQMHSFALPFVCSICYFSWRTTATVTSERHARIEWHWEGETVREKKRNDAIAKQKQKVKFASFGVLLVFSWRARSQFLFLSYIFIWFGAFGRQHCRRFSFFQLLQLAVVVAKNFNTLPRQCRFVLSFVFFLSSVVAVNFKQQQQRGALPAAAASVIVGNC